MAKIEKLTQFDYYHLLEQTTGKVLVFFTSPACGSCRQFKRAVEELMKQDEPLQVFEVDAVHEAGLVESFNVFHLPGIFLYLDGEYHCELQTEALPSKIKQAIELASQQAAEEEP